MGIKSIKLPKLNFSTLLVYDQNQLFVQQLIIISIKYRILSEPFQFKIYFSINNLNLVLFRPFSQNKLTRQRLTCTKFMFGGLRGLLILALRRLAGSRVRVLCTLIINQRVVPFKTMIRAHGSFQC